MKIAVFYYTQSGQALVAARSICSPMVEAGVTVVYKEIVPQQTYPFPWSKYEFFDTFPETRLGLPPSGIKEIDFSDVEDARLVLIVGQSWFLSPSLPLQSFFANSSVKSYLKEKEIVFVNACRNMWLMTSRKVKAYLADCDARLVGHIVLQDEAPNLVSAFTIIRWLIYGKKEATALLPPAGIPDKQLSDASRFGKIMLEAIEKDNTTNLQEKLLQAGGIWYKPTVLFVEKIGHRMFGLWAKFIREKGGFRDERRRFRLNLFYVYLMIVLFLLSPLPQIFFYLTYPLQHVAKNKREDCSV